MTYRELDEAANRVAHLLAAMGWARGSVWRCCFPGRRRRSWRSWRCSRPERRMCRSIRRCRRRGCSWCSMTPRRSSWSPPPRWPTGLDGFDLAVIDVDDLEDPAVDQPTRHRTAGAGPRRYRLHHLHLGHHGDPQGGGHHPPQRVPAAGLTACELPLRRGGCGRSVIPMASMSRCERSGARCLGGGRLVVVPESVVARAGRPAGLTGR